MKRNIIKEEKGAISTLVLFTILIFIAILMGTYMLVTINQKSQLKSDMRIQDIYGEDVDKVNELYNEIVNEFLNEEVNEIVNEIVNEQTI